MESVEAAWPVQSGGVPLERWRELVGDSLEERLRQGSGFPRFERVPARWDGVPLNDPFTGEARWLRVVPLEMERIEIVRGAPGGLFGDRAAEGLVSVFSRPPKKRTFGFSYELGNRATHDLETRFSTAGSRWLFSAFTRAYTSDGYYVAATENRGAADRPAGLRFFTAGLHAGYRVGTGGLYVKAGLLGEERSRGTALQRSSAGLGQISLRYRAESDAGTFLLGSSYSRQALRGSYSAVGEGRSTERLTLTQRTPAEGASTDVLWHRHRGAWNLWTGADASRSSGWTTARLPGGGSRVRGGTLNQRGAFVQGDVAGDGLRLFGGLRESGAGRGYRFLCSSAGLVAGQGRTRLRLAAHRGFRAPTLDELYRERRLDNSITEPDETLRPERTYSLDAGLDWTGTRATFRLTVYRRSFEDLLADRTVSLAPALILRRSANLGTARTRGVETGWTKHTGRWRIEMNYLYADSRMSLGTRLPHWPRHQGRARATWTRKRSLFSLGLNAWGARFDDDLNRFLAPGYATFQLLARQGLSDSWSARISFDNLLNRSYLTAFTPAPRTGAPRIWRLGMVWESRLR